MADHPFAALLDLITFDDAIRQMHEQVTTLNADVAAIKQQQQEAVDKVETTRRKMIDAKKAVDELELKMKELAVAEQQKKERLDKADDHKVYRALRAEIETVQHSMQAGETALIAAVNAAEAAQKEFEAQKEGFGKLNVELETALKEAEAKIMTLTADVVESETVRKKKEEKVPEEWRERYAAMRMRVTDPVVPILEQECSACFQPVTSQDMIRLTRGALIQCQGCFRLLYLKEVMPGGGEAEAVSVSETTE